MVAPAAPTPPGQDYVLQMQAFDEMVRIRPSLKKYLHEVELGSYSQLQTLKTMVQQGEFWSMADALEALEQVMRKHYQPFPSKLTRR